MKYEGNSDIFQPDITYEYGPKPNCTVVFKPKVGLFWMFILYSGDSKGFKVYNGCEQQSLKFIEGNKHQGIGCLALQPGSFPAVISSFLGPHRKRH